MDKRRSGGKFGDSETVRLSDPRSARVSTFRTWPFNRTSSNSTLGGGALVSRARGSKRTKPFTVEKQSKPAFVFRPAGQNPLEHSSVGIPSPTPKARG